MDSTTRQFLILVALLALVAAIYLLRHPGAIGVGPTEEGASEPSVHLTMGNPSKATDDGRDPGNYLMRKPYFALSYNDGKGTPNWVSWCLRAEDLGSAPRAQQFEADPELPGNFHRVFTKDYNGSGFDRGHMCPHGDRMATNEMSFATFIMTNVVPQAPHLNQKAWTDLEEYCRTQAKKTHGALYIVCGPQGRGGEGSKGKAESIAGGQVVVPGKCWKVAMILPNGTGSPADVGLVTPQTRLIAVVMPNDQSVGRGWAKYRVSVQEVEGLTGYRFFDRVPAEVIDVSKARVDAEHIPIAR